MSFTSSGLPNFITICTVLQYRFINIGTIQDHGVLAEYASEFGSYCQFDLFGIENSYYQIKPSIDFMSDAQRIAMIQSLIDEKFEDKILMAHDIHTKHRLVH